MSFSPEIIRKEFPILETEIRGRKLVYLDNAATTQMPQSVLDTIIEQHHQHEANVHRGIHFLSEKSTARMEEARKIAAEFLGTEDFGEIIFTSGTTEAINLAARSFSEAFLRVGDEIVTTAMEHHSNLVPWQQAAHRCGAVCKVLPFDAQGELCVDKLDAYITEKTKIVAVCAVSNVLGTVNPIERIIDKAHAVGAKVLIDGAQAVRHGKCNVKALDCDFFAFSGHKIMGPTGTGVLYGKRELLEAMPPVCFGGGMVGTVTQKRAAFGDLPFKFEAGTPNIVGNIALGAALQHYMAIANEASAYETELLAYMEKRLRELPQAQIIGTPIKRSGVLSFNLSGAHYYDVAAMLDKLGIAVRSGHHCAEPLLRCYDLSGAVRISPAYYNTFEEADALISGLHRIIRVLEGNKA